MTIADLYLLSLFMGSTDNSSIFSGLKNFMSQNQGQHYLSLKQNFLDISAGRKIDCIQF